MTDLFIAYRRADKERVDLIRQSLTSLGLTMAADIEPKGRGAAKAIRDAAASARVVLALGKCGDLTAEVNALLAEHDIETNAFSPVSFFSSLYGQLDWTDVVFCV